MPDWESIVAEWWKQQPHPMEPRLKIGEFATAVKMATRAKFGSPPGHAEPHEAAAHWQEFQTTNQRLASQGKEPVSPEEYGHLLDQIAPLSFTYHGRPPTLHELVQLRDQPPARVREHYASLPDQHYPSVPAGDMVRALEAAKPHANEHIGRDPVKKEAAYLYHSRDHPRDYYASMVQGDQSGQQQQQDGQNTDELQAPTGRR